MRKCFLRGEDVTPLLAVRPTGVTATDGSAEFGFNEVFAFVAELEGEEVVSLVKGLEEESVPFPHFLREQFGLGQPHKFAFVAVGERAGELRAGEEMHVFHAPFI